MVVSTDQNSMFYIYIHIHKDTCTVYIKQATENGGRVYVNTAWYIGHSLINTPFLFVPRFSPKPNPPLSLFLYTSHPHIFMLVIHTYYFSLCIDIIFSWINFIVVRLFLFTSVIIQNISKWNWRKKKFFFFLYTTFHLKKYNIHSLYLFYYFRVPYYFFFSLFVHSCLDGDVFL